MCCIYFLIKCHCMSVAIADKLKVDFAKAQIKDTVNGYEITLLFTVSVFNFWCVSYYNVKASI